MPANPPPTLGRIVLVRPDVNDPTGEYVGIVSALPAAVPGGPPIPDAILATVFVPFERELTTTHANHQSLLDAQYAAWRYPTEPLQLN